MAESNQFMDIVGKHPEILKAMKAAEEKMAKKKAEEEAGVTEEKKEVTADAPKKAFNPFSKVKKTISTLPETEKKYGMHLPPMARELIERNKNAKIQQVVVVEEEDNDPALETVAQQPEGTVLNPDVTVKSMKKTTVAKQQSKPDIKGKAAVEETKIKDESKEDQPKEQVSKEEQPVKNKEQEQKNNDKNNVVLAEALPEEEVLTPTYFLEHVEDLKQRYFFHDLEQFKHSLCERINAITIPNDINVGMAKVRIAEIDQLRNELLERRIEIKMLYDCPFENNKGDIAVAARAQAQGSSDGERNRLYCSYLKNFPVKEGVTINVSYVRTILSMYNTIFDAAIADLVEKRQALILIFSGFKIDASMS